MAVSNYPAGYDNLPDPDPTDTLDDITVDHALLHQSLNAAIEAMQQVMGLNPMGNYSTILARMEALGFASMTSTTSRAIGIGSKTFTVNDIGWYTEGTRVRIMDAAAVDTNWMEGVITDITGLDVTVLTDLVGGSGTKSSWVFTVAGAQGIVGPTGPANSLAIGTVTTGAAGSSASATITGTAPSQTLDLTIPKGDQGIQGIQGIQGVKGDPGDVSTSQLTEAVRTQAEILTIAVSDEVTALTTGAGKVTFRAPFAMTLTAIPRASLTTASSSGLVTVDINESGVSVLGTDKLSIDANERTSTTAATATTLADTTIADDAEITIDIDSAGTGAKGLKVTLYFRRT